MWTVKGCVLTFLAVQLIVWDFPQFLFELSELISGYFSLDRLLW